MAHSTRLAVLVAVALAWLVVGEASAHEVLGTIYNSSNLTYSLSYSFADYGIITQEPASTLMPYSSTTFAIRASNWVTNNVIDYAWTYSPLSYWCPTGIPAPAYGTFYYSYGSNSCTGSEAGCSKTGTTLDTSVSSCGTRYGTSEPLYTIFIDWRGSCPC